MRLLKLTLRNFKGIKEFTLDVGGANASIFADNGVGKTTLDDAYSWLLHGKDSHNRADFDIKTLDEQNNPIHGLDHEVEGVFRLLKDGRTVTLARCYKEQWTRRRGSAERRFTGHTTTYSIDGVSRSKREFDDFVASIADEHVFRLLSDPLYFNEHLHWEKQRELVIQVAGDVSDEDVIASDEALAALPEILGDRALEDHRKVIMSRRAEINKELDRIPVRIDEVDRGLPELPEADKATLQGQLAKLREQRSAKDAEKTRIESGGEVAEQRKRLTEIETEMLDAKRRVRASVDEKIRKKVSLRDSLHDRKTFLESELTSHRHAINTANATIQYNERLMADYRDEWGRLDAETFVGELRDVEDACAACGQGLPAEQVADARAKAQADLDKRRAEFNEGKAKRLADISERGKQLKQANEAEAGRIAEAEGHIKNLSGEVEQVTAELAGIALQISELQTQVPDVTLDPEHARLAAEKADIEAAIAKLQADSTEALAAVNAAIQALDEQIASVEASVALYDQHERGEKRKAELADEERKLAAEFERLEHELFLTDEFTKAKVRLLDERINSKFKIARFKMFNVQVNGGIEPTCQTLLNGVPWNSINGAGRIQVGLDIINTLAEHYGFSPPVFIDDAVTITDIPETTGQQIRLVVSAADKTLRVATDTDQQLKEAV